MNKKLIVANLMLAVLATACGDSTYVPNGNVPFGQGTFNGLPNQPFNPMLNQPFANQPIMNQPFNWQNPQQQMILQNQLQWQAQMQAQNTGCFPQYRTTGCFPQTRPTCSSVYTNYYAPNRHYILSSDNRLYSTGYYVVTSSGRGRRKCYKAVPIYTYSTNRSVDVKCLTCSDRGNSTVATTTTTVTTTTSHGSSTSGTVVTGGNTSTNNSSGNKLEKQQPIVFGSNWGTEEQAKALYDRLNVKEVEAPEEKNKIQKIGKNIQCEKSGGFLSKKTYTCQLVLNMTDVNVKEMKSPQEALKSTDRGYKTPENYMAKSSNNISPVMIGGDQRGMDEALLTFGKNTNNEDDAKELFEKMDAPEVSDKQTGTNNTTVSKTKGALKCYRTTNSTDDGYYCEVKLQPSTGLIQADYSAAAPASAAESEDDSGKDQTQSEKVNPAGSSEAPKTETEAPKTETEAPKTETEGGN